MRRPRRESRRSTLLGLIVVPAVVAAMILVAHQGWRGPRTQGVTTGSSQDSSESGTPPPEAVPSTSSPATEELTAEENLAINPPPPTDVRVVDMTEASVEIRWDPPPSVSGAHHYSDKVVAYRIYRRAGGHLDFRPLAVTAATTYTDRKVKTDHSYEYVVSSVHRHHVEGSRSDPPAIATIGP